jgi:hypothetical protein
MNALIARIEHLVAELVGQQAAPDDFWIAELASIKEALADLFHARSTQSERENNSNSRGWADDRQQSRASSR